MNEPREDMAPGDEAPPGEESTGEDICAKCSGSGEVDGADCPDCGGSGRVIVPIGGG